MRRHPRHAVSRPASPPRGVGAWVSALLLASVLLYAPAAPASQIGTIFSGPTSADAASVYWNPAAMTQLKGTRIMLFGAISAVRLSYQPAQLSLFDGSTYPEADVFVPKPSPAFGLVTDATLRDWRFGVGFSLPLLDGATWESSYDGRPSSTRYFAEAARLGKFIIHGTAAYRINSWISIGVGLDVYGVMLRHQVRTDFGSKINQIACASNPQSCSLSSPLLRENPSFDAPTDLEGMGWGVGFSAGILLQPLPWLRIGAGIHSGAGAVTIPVTLSVDLPQPVTDYMRNNFPSVGLPALSAEGEVEVTTPIMANVGISISATPKLELAADLHWMNTSQTVVMVGTITKDQSSGLIGDQVLIKARGDALLLGLRASYRVLEPLLVALRFEYDRNTRPDEFISPISIDFHRFSFHLGARWRFSRYLAVSFEYGHYIMPSRTITSSRFAPNANPTTPAEDGLDKPSATGRYTAAADRFGLAVQVGF
jgi:long-chain fatty acid transport protein